MSEVIGYTTPELVEVMMRAGIHCSLDQFKRVAMDLQRKALDKAIEQVASTEAQ
ncbi:MAG TPA: hypothetical protein VGU01_02950 [Sphingomicrobium sp.]|uniref:hypothetical protein n=1 Tax=Paraburkholderia aspalathi TaxID=1324617 RepID=UPI00190E4E49|nr:hypothetical protein [Paraburkholderia aspalathi]MBK3841743.1 hypothetical protein [Paraburkholderia aspalathi]CAE6811341.1 hypothetical protein R69746_05634 [Paraburkholderia aspalathi]HEV2594143.1 hypothetical protein [Sphingomicrobium sp.]